MKKYIVMTLLLNFPLINAEMKIYSYNITHGKKNDWNKRKPNVLQLIQDLNADIYCLQEVIDENDQLKSIQDILPQYNYVGDKRNNHISGLSIWLRLTTLGAQNERCPIFYNKNKFDLIDSQTFGINPNGSGYLPRTAVKIHLKEKSTGKEFFVYNTHLDHKYEKVRTEQAQMISDDIKQKCADKPVILLGDFNTTFDKDLKKILTEDGFTHAKTIAQQVEGPSVTHEKGSTKALIECDFIFVKPQSKFSISQYKTVDSIPLTKDSKKPVASDHNPVGITCSLKE